MALAPSLTLPSDHPSLSDAAYRARRHEIASIGETFHQRRPDPCRPVHRRGARRLAARLERAGVEARARRVRGVSPRAPQAVSLPTDRVPQLAWVSKRLTDAHPAFASSRCRASCRRGSFYGSLADRCFLSTQYVRHPSVPLYTPEPDVIHEVIGHTNQLGHPLFADLYEAMGRAVRRVETDDALDRFSRVWWFTLEFGVVHERGDLKTYGAGILSSFGELDAYRHAEVRPFDLRRWRRRTTTSRRSSRCCSRPSRWIRSPTS